MKTTKLQIISFVLAIAMVLTLPSFSCVVKAKALPKSTTASAETPSNGTPSETPSDASSETPEEKPTTKNGLVKVDGDYYFFKDGEAIKSSWQTVKDKEYYFGKDGRAYANGYYYISHYYCKFNNKAVLTRKIDRNKKMVALTYDDGPASGTPRILKALKKCNGAATFFVVGSRLKNKKHISYVKQAYAQDCEIGNHSYNHKIFTKISAKTMKSEVADTQKAVKAITGEEPVLFRPPGGAVNQSVKNTVKMPLIIWSIDTIDWKTRNAAKTRATVLNKAKDGDIILMHDLWTQTADASEKFIPELTKKGFQLVTVSELAACRKITMKKGETVHQFRKASK